MHVPFSVFDVRLDDAVYVFICANVRSLAFLKERLQIKLIGYRSLNFCMLLILEFCQVSYNIRIWWWCPEYSQELLLISYFLPLTRGISIPWGIPVHISPMPWLQNQQQRKEQVSKKEQMSITRDMAGTILTHWVRGRCLLECQSDHWAVFLPAPSPCRSLCQSTAQTDSTIFVQ